jgi:hypothetical protein
MERSIAVAHESNVFATRFDGPAKKVEKMRGHSQSVTERSPKKVNSAVLSSRTIVCVCVCVFLFPTR